MQAPASDDPPVRLPTIPELGREAETLRRGFARRGAMAVLCLDLRDLVVVERRQGAEAWRQVLGRVADRLHQQLAGHLEPDDRVVLGEIGESELLVLMLRARDDAGFLRDELPGLARDLERHLAPPGNRLAYPFVRDALRIFVGSAVVFHDPLVRPERALQHACALAREDARLAARLAARARREALVDLMLRGRLAIALEPIVELGDRRPMGWEALVRGPSRSELASPRALFGAAEEGDLTFELDCRCRAAALDAAKRLPAGARLFVNCLPSAIHDPAFQGHALRENLQARGLQPSDVVFEISEAESISNWEIFREVCDHYAGLGFGIALDDVGAGYGSLEAVAELRPDYMKVDLAFVRGIDADPARQEV
ncbi:MAG: EAL domain-containing protein, partial [Myxococcota bacterium]|nr:EAL domain-containing protein [Myxococcota bacterium]